MSNQGKAKQDNPKLPRVLFIPFAKRTLICVIAFKNRVRWVMGKLNEIESEVLARAQKTKPMVLDCEAFDLRYIESWNGRSALIYTDDKGRVLCGTPQAPAMDPASALQNLAEQLARASSKKPDVAAKPEEQKTAKK